MKNIAIRYGISFVTTSESSRVIDLTTFFRIASLALRQWCDCLSVSEETLKDMGTLGRHLTKPKHQHTAKRDPYTYFLKLLYLFEDCMPIMKYCLAYHGFQKPCMISLNSLQRNPSNKHSTKWHDTHAILPSDSNRYSRAVTHYFGFLVHKNDTCFCLVWSTHCHAHTGLHYGRLYSTIFVLEFLGVRCIFFLKWPFHKIR